MDDAAAALARVPVDVIAAFGLTEAKAAQKATQTIPIVAMSIGDPVAAGLLSIGAPRRQHHRKHHSRPECRQQAAANPQWCHPFHFARRLSRESGQCVPSGDFGNIAERRHYFT